MPITKLWQKIIPTVRKNKGRNHEQSLFHSHLDYSDYSDGDDDEGNLQVHNDY